MSVATTLIREFQSWFTSPAARTVLKETGEAVAPQVAKIERQFADRLVLSSAAKEATEAAGKLLKEAAEVSGKAAQEATEAGAKTVSAGEALLAKRRIAMNRINGDRRELIVERFLRKRFPEREGFTVHAEQYLRDQAGEIARDLKSGQARRLDFVVFQGDEARATIEVTSRTASKVAQTAKELNIRHAGGRYLINPATGQLVKLPTTQETALLRLL